MMEALKLTGKIVGLVAIFIGSVLALLLLGVYLIGVLIVTQKAAYVALTWADFEHATLVSYVAAVTFTLRISGLAGALVGALKSKGD